MADGTVSIWDPSKMISPTPGVADVGKVNRHKGPVNALHFNPHRDSSHLLASGGAYAYFAFLF
jgi:WD40 repeat protein